MAKEILVYGSIYDWSVAPFIKEVEAASGQDITIRVNSPGGSPLSNFGMIAKIKEHQGGVKVKVDGQAASSAAYFCLYASEVESLDVSQFLFHRAAYPDWLEASKDYFTEDMRNSLIKVNADLRAAMEGKFTAEKWKEVTGFSLDDLFSLDSRIDVTISAEQAKVLGIVTKIVNITPAKKAELHSLIAAHAPELLAKFNAEIIAQVPEQKVTTQNINKMTVAELQASHPEVYAAIIKAERDRVGSYIVYAHLDLEACKKGIESGEPMSQTQMSEFALKSFQASQLAAIEGGNAPEVKTPEAAGKETKEEADKKAFFAEVNKNLGISK